MPSNKNYTRQTGRRTVLETEIKWTLWLKCLFKLEALNMDGGFKKKNRNVDSSLLTVKVH